MPLVLPTNNVSPAIATLPTIGLPVSNLGSLTALPSSATQRTVPSYAAMYTLPFATAGVPYKAIGLFTRPQLRLEDPTDPTTSFGSHFNSGGNPSAKSAVVRSRA